MNNKYEIITRKSSDCKFNLFNFSSGISIKEFIILFIFFLINTIISILLISTSFWLSLIFFLFSFSFSFILILPVKNENIKIYQLLKLKFIFLIDKKVIKQKLLNENCVVKAVKYNIIYLKNNYFGLVLQISALDILDNNDSEIFLKIDNLYSLFNDLSNIDYDIVKFDLTIDKNKQINFLNNNLLLKNKLFSNYKNNLNNSSKFLNNNQANYFLILKSYDKNKLLNLQNSLLSNKSFNLKINKPELEISDYIASYFTFSNFKSDIKILKNYIKQDKTYYSLKSILKFPSQVFSGWGKNIFNIDDVDIYLKKYTISIEEAIKRIDSTIQRAQSLDNSKFSKKLENYEFLDDFTKLQNYIKIENENINLIEIFFIINANSPKELKRKERELKLILHKNNFEIKNNKYQQKQLFNKLLLDFSKKKFLSQEISNRALSYVWPFTNSNLNDENGFLIGNNIKNNEPIFFDIKKRNSFRTNSNTLILGKTGSGKTFNAKNQIYWNAINNIKTFIIDPENEYNDLKNNFKTSIIDFKNKNINLLEIISENIFSHIELIEQFFKIIFSNISDIDLFYLQKYLIKLYNDFNITDKNISSIKDWPTIKNLLELINKYKDLIENSNIIYYLLKLKNFNFYDTQTNIKNDSLITIFNINSLSINNNIRNGQLFLLINWINQQIKYNKQNNIDNNLNNWISLVIDEAHLLLNDDNLITLKYFSQLTKRIRKYNCILILITQNINDFLGSNNIKKETTAIINNLQYLFIHQLAANDLNNLNELLRIQRKLTTYQKTFLTKALQGECILINNNSFEYIKILDLFNKCSYI